MWISTSEKKRDKKLNMIRLMKKLITYQKSYDISYDKSYDFSYDSSMVFGLLDFWIARPPNKLTKKIIQEILIGCILLNQFLGSMSRSNMRIFNEKLDSNNK